MKFREFGNTGLEVSEVGFGAWAIGGPAMAGDIPIGWGDVDDNTSIAALKKAKDQGINFYDTADFYGLGHSEELLGKVWGNRKDIIIATKVGHRLDQRQNIFLDYSNDYIVNACEASLRRLKRETIDFYQLHAAKLEHLKDGKCLSAMNQLQKQGKIRYWGISLNTYDPEPEAGFFLDKDPESNRFIAHGFQLVFNIINQKALPIIKKSKDRGIGIIARMPLQFGLLSGRFNKSSTFPGSDHRSFRLTPNVLKRSIDELEAVWPIAEKYGASLSNFALSFVLSHAEISTVIPGIKTPEQAVANTENIQLIEKSDLDLIHKMNSERFEELLIFMKSHG